MLKNLTDIGARDLICLTIGFVLGAFSSPLHVWGRNMKEGTHVKLPRPNKKHVFYALTAIVVAWSLWATQSTQNENRKIATENRQIAEEVQAVQRRERECYAQFYQAITVNRAINEDITKIENQLTELADSDSDALFKFVVAIANLPAEIANLPVEDPERVKYKRDLTLQYIGVLQANSDSRANLKNQRKEKFASRVPYPEPKCGRE